MEFLQGIGVFAYLVIGYHFSNYFFDITQDAKSKRKNNNENGNTDGLVAWLISILAGLFWPIVVVIGLFKTFIK